MPSISQVRSSNASFAPSYIPVAVFVGGTSGIGKAMAEALAHYTNGNAHIILVGRNKPAADAIIASFPKPASSATPGNTESQPIHEFVPCDASLMSNIHAVTNALTARLGKINYLVLSTGYLQFLGGRVETTEGIDEKLALMYYARWTFIRAFAPLLRNAQAQGEDARVLSVLAAGSGTEIDLDDLGLAKHYGPIKAMGVGPTYNDLMLDEFARRNPGVTFVHAFPGPVITNIYTPSRWYLRPLAALLRLLMYPFSIAVGDCAEYMWWALLDSEAGGFSMRGERGDVIEGKRFFGGGEPDDGRRRLWEHTEKTVDAAIGE